MKFIKSNPLTEIITIHYKAPHFLWQSLLLWHLYPSSCLGNLIRNWAAEKSISRWKQVQLHQFFARVHSATIKATVLVTRKTAGRSAQGSKAAQEGAFSRSTTLSLMKALSTFQCNAIIHLQEIKCWDKWCTVSKCSHMHTLLQPEMLIILQGQHAKEHYPVKTGSLLSHHSLGYFPNQSTFFPLFFAVWATLLPLPKHDTRAKCPYCRCRRMTL